MSSSEDISTRIYKHRQCAMLVDDLETTVTVDFVLLLKAFFARMLKFASPQRSKSDLMREADKLFEIVLKDAVSFCNADGSQEAQDRLDASTERCAQLKQHLRLYACSGSDLERSAHVANALNVILLQCRSSSIADRLDEVFPVTKEFSFRLNSPTFIECSNTASRFRLAKRKPVVVAAFSSSFQQIDAVGADTADDIDTAGDTDKFECGSIYSDDAAEMRVKLSWLDVLQSWDIRPATNDLDTSALSAPYILEQLPSHSRESEPGCDEQRKRRNSDASDESSNKRTRTAACHDPEFVEDEPYSDCPDYSYLQSAVYALERLAAAWNITHFTAVQLTDEKLILRWYDPEGCIESARLDIIRHLPLFVSMICVFQRFDQRMWGMDSEEIQILQIGHAKYKLKEDNKSELYAADLAGRRTYTAVAESVIQEVEQQPIVDKYHTRDSPGPSRSHPAMDIQKSPPSHGLYLEREEGGYFFKASWVDCSRTKEPVVVAEARSRAEQYLGEYKSYVLDHIPQIDNWEERTQSSTGIIRELLNGSSAYSRVQIIIVARRLCKLAKVEDPESFLSAFWDAVRCHYLLWRIGIAHGDISLNNLMYDEARQKGVLNDFDLSTLMAPGTETLGKQGSEHTGTKPFMALELLEHHKGTIKRRYRHDLESFGWCLAYHCFEEASTWKDGTFLVVWKDKSWFLMNFNRLKWKGSTSLLRTIRPWLRHILEQLIAYEDEEATKGTDQVDQGSTAVEVVNLERGDDEAKAEVFDSKRNSTVKEDSDSDSGDEIGKDAKFEPEAQWKEPSIKESLQAVIGCMNKSPFEDMAWIDFTVAPASK